MLPTVYTLAVVACLVKKFQLFTLIAFFFTVCSCPVEFRKAEHMLKVLSA